MIDIALKEWAATCLALDRGEQIVLLRKGGLRDEEGAFQLESRRFWLMPTYLHQDSQLVKNQHQSLLREAVPEEGEGDRFVKLALWAEAVRTWALPPGHDDALKDVRHIWTDSYLDIRRSFRPEQPILCTALRVHRIGQPHSVRVQPHFLGCRSWIDVSALSENDSQPVLTDAAFAAALADIERVIPTES